MDMATIGSEWNYGRLLLFGLWDLGIIVTSSKVVNIDSEYVGNYVYGLAFSSRKVAPQIGVIGLLYFGRNLGALCGIAGFLLGIFIQYRLPEYNVIV